MQYLCIYDLRGKIIYRILYIGLLYLIKLIILEISNVIHKCMYITIMDKRAVFCVHR